MKKILVPTDFSENANNAFFYALAFASEIEASIILLHVVEMEMAVSDMPLLSGSAYQAKKEAAELAIQAQVEIARGLNTGWADTKIRTETKVEFGNPVPNIKSIAEKKKVDLIIMGARGSHKSTLAKMLGTRSSAIAQQARCPVLIIPEGALFRPVIQLAYASELSSADPYELWRALDLIKPFSPVVRYLHVSQGIEETEVNSEDRIRKYIESQNSALQLVFYQINAQDIDKELEKQSRTFDVDLIVIYHKSKNIFQRMFTHSHTKHLLSMSDIPVLVLNEE
ncbi:MAG: universal stress protein [Saprospiraceae bacterium]|nr:universal stress protein [Saprospiraceae bacterium]